MPVKCTTDRLFGSILTGVVLTTHTYALLLAVLKVSLDLRLVCLVCTGDDPS